MSAIETQLLDGRATAAEIRREVQRRVLDLRAAGVRPGLAAVLVGENPASKVYVGSKVRTCQELGLYSEKIDLPDSISTEDLVDQVEALNRRESIDGILIQLPLPGTIDTRRIIEAVSPAKDVDGFHPISVGRLCRGEETLVPCTPAGILELLKRNKIAIAGRHAVVVGRSDIVGKPVSMLLLQQHATVTICHSRTTDLAAVTRRADILIAAVGRPAMLQAEHVAPGAVVIDVGINSLRERAQVLALFGESSPRVAEFERKGATLVGDVHPLNVLGTAGYLTPVPGGVGPLTIAMLMSNTVTAAMRRRGIPAPK